MAATPPAASLGPDVLPRLCPVAPFQEGRGGVVRDGGWLEARGADGTLIERVRLPERLAAMSEQTFLGEYLVCDLFTSVLWYIGQPFSSKVQFLVDYKLNGHECTGELLVPGHQMPYSWEIIVSHDLSLFEMAELPSYLFDISFPWWRVHEHMDVVLRRRLVQELEQFACAGQGRFKVSRGEEHNVEVSNLFSTRPTPDNRPHIVTLGRDIYQARRGGNAAY